MAPPTPEPGAVAELAEDITRIASALDEIATTVRGAVGTQGSLPEAPQTLAYVAIHVAHYYNALEEAFERSARLFGTSSHAGPTWHADLLRHAARPLPTLRPPLVPEDRREPARELLRFRHFLRHAYAIRFDPERMRPAVDALRVHHEAFAAQLRAFRDFLLALLEP